MIELLILLTLQDEKYTIYKIRQNIEKKYGFFLNISFGSIHPAVKRLENQKYVAVKKSVSTGGQRSSVYSITDSGRSYFNQLMLEALPENPLVAGQLINIKLMSLSILNDETKLTVKKSILDYLELRKITSKNLIASGQDTFNDMQLKFINYNINNQSVFIEWVKSKV